MQQRFPCFYVVCQTEVASIPRLRKTQAGMVALRAAPQRKASTVRAIWQRAMLALPHFSIAPLRVLCANVLGFTSGD